MTDEKKQVVERDAGAQAPDTGRRFVTFDELCTEDPVRDRGEKYLPRYDAWIAYRARVPLQKIVGWQRRFLRGKKRDMAGMMQACLMEIMLEPRPNPNQMHLLLKADGKVMLELVNEVLGEIDEDMEEEVGDEVGES